MKQLETSHEFGLYIEIKWSSYFNSLGITYALLILLYLGLNIEEPLVQTLENNKVNRSSVFIQSFEHSNLRELKKSVLSMILKHI